MQGVGKLMLVALGSGRRAEKVLAGRAVVPRSSTDVAEQQHVQGVTVVGEG